MAQELPEVPKVSMYIEPLARPESEIESRIEEAIRVTPPPGPGSLALRLARAVEGRRTPALPGAPRVEELLPRGLPELPEAEVKSKVAEEKTEVESKVAGEKKPARREYSSKIA